MLFNSTRNNKLQINASNAILKGISEDGGLFIPENFPKISECEIASMVDMNYCQRAEKVLSLFLTDFSSQQIENCVKGAYTIEKFAYNDIAHLNKEGDTNYLELWHGPTCAFKDMALQLLPRLLVTSMEINKTEKEIVILVATSGDTGKAALEGFKDVDKTKIIVYYPQDGVSSMQKRQMQTQEGSNVSVSAIYGNFDDAQTGVKRIFTDNKIAEKLSSNGFEFSSANSINWGRLVPQIVYYFSSYADMIKKGEIKVGEKINFCVPTGNFGNILAGYYAKLMGLPVNKFICASNKNKILTDFINTGVYNKNREFYQTISPSMDILISSNLERLLYLLSGNNSDYINEIFSSLFSKGEYKVTDEILNKLKDEFYAGFCTDEQTVEQIKNKFNQTGYLMDSHTAVADFVYDEYKKNTKDNTKTVVVSTASPYKFSASVLKAIDDNFNPDDDEFIMTEKIHKISGLEIPQQLKDLKNKSVIFKNIIKKENMEQSVYDFLKIK